jgi:hypothetical protein
VSKKNEVNRQIIISKQKYYKHDLQQNKSQKSMWKTLQSLLPTKKSSNDIPTELSPDDFNEYFSTVGDNLAQNFDSTVKTPWRNPQCLYDFKFDPLQKEDVVNCLSCLNHSSKLDLFDFVTKLLRIAANIIGESLCYILNLSLITGEIPLDWKKAKVTPLY